MTEQPAAEQGASSTGQANFVVSVLRWVFVALGIALGGVALSLALVMVFAIPIDLSPLRGQIASLASSALDRRINIDGPLTLLPTLTPALQVEGVRLGNPEGWPDAKLARLDRARVRLAILPLLRGELRIDEMDIQGLVLQLETNAAGEPNWRFGTPQEAPAPQDMSGPPTWRLAELRQVTARDIRVTHYDAVTGEKQELELNEVTGAAAYLGPIAFSVNGIVQQLPYQLSFTGGGLKDLLEGGGQPWPLEVAVMAAGARLRVAGTVAEPLRDRGHALDFELLVPNTEALRALIGPTLLPIDQIALTGHLAGGEGRYRLEALTGTLGDAAISGHYAIDIKGTKPAVRGALHIGRLDVGSLRETVEEAYPDTGLAVAESDQPAQEWDLDAPFLSLEMLSKLDADFTLTVDEVVGALTDLQSASLGVQIADGTLTAPLALTVAEVPFDGKISLRSRDGSPALKVSLTATGAEIGHLADFLLDAEGIAGRFAYAQLDLAAEVQTLRSLVKTSVLNFALAEAELSYGHETDGRPVAFVLDRLDMTFPAEERSRIAATGSLLDEPFTAELIGGTFFEKFFLKQWPVALTATGGGGRLTADGTIVPEGDTRLDFDLAGERVGGLNRWLGLSPAARMPYQLRGQLILFKGAEVRVGVAEGRVGNTRFNGEVGVYRERETPVTRLALEADVIDIGELRGLIVEDPQPGNAKPVRSEVDAIDVPVLPKGLELMDADIDLAIKRLKTKPVEVRRFRVSSQIRDGHVERAPFRAVVAGASFQGTFGADLRGALPRVNLALKAQSLDVGDLLAQLDVIEGLDLTLEQIDLSAAITGASAREMLARSTLTASVQGGLWRVRDPNLGETLDIGIGQGQFTAGRDQPMVLSLDGRIEQRPLQIELKTDPLGSFVQSKERLRLEVAIAGEKTEAKLTGVAPLPMQTDDLHFQLVLEGKQLSDFNELLDVSLPPWGRYALRGEFGTERTGYYVRGVQVRVGESQLSGDLKLNTAHKPPRLDVALQADSIQLDDFDTQGWNLEDDGSHPSTASKAQAAVSKKRALLSSEVMGSLDGEIKVEVKEVLSGADRLGQGRLQATLREGRFSVDPLTLEVPGGSVRLAFALEPTAADIALSATAKIDELDYGYLARRIDPASTVAGLISVDADVRTRGVSLDNVMHESNGHIDFAIWPRGVRAGVFDLWATNLLTAFLPLLDPSARSQVNCVVARLRIDDGIMRPSVVLIDATRVQAAATGVVDFKAQRFDFTVVPRAKRPQFFRAETPLELRGEFSNFSIGASPAALLQTTVRIVTSPVVVPFEWVFTEQPAADGKVSCQRAWSGPLSPSPDEQKKSPALPFTH